MHLINPRLIKTRLQVAAIPLPHLEILQAWRDSIENRSIFKQNETSFDGHFIQKILIDILGYNQDLTTARTLWKNKPLGSGNVDVALGNFSNSDEQILAPVELKGAKTKDLDAIMSGRHKSPVQQAWEYAMDAPGAQWVILSNYLEIRLYAVGYGKQHYEIWDLTKLTDPVEYARLQWLISAKQLLSGATRQILEQSEQIEKQITNQLYNDYSTLREQLLRDLTAANPAVQPLELIRHSQTILDRILFIAFAEDRGLLPDKTITQAYQQCNVYAPQPIWENFKSLFRAIDSGNAALKIHAYNGGLFAPNIDLDSLVVNDSLCEGFKRIADYDFASEVSVTVLGHIFEQSISDIEELQAQVRGDVNREISKRKQHGVVYTPDYITNFIVEQALGRYLQSQFEQLWQATAKQRYSTGTWKNKTAEVEFWRTYQQILRHTRILDPACGSGAFLVAAFERLYEEYTRVNNMLADLTGGSYGVFDLDKEILNHNLYGVDINAESIEITKLSLWLKTAKPGKVLNDLEATIRVGNSLIDDPIYTDKPFVWTQFAIQLQTSGATLFDNSQIRAIKHAEAPPSAKMATNIETSLGFDVILGNPPYVRQELLSPIKPYLQQHYTCYHGVVDLYAYFFELGLNLLKPGGRLGYICSSTFFKTSSGENLRRLLQDHANLETIVDFRDLQIFAGVTTYPAILTMRKLPPETGHELQILTLKQNIPADLSKYFSTHATTMPQANLDRTAWRLENTALVNLRRKLTAGKSTLKQVYGSPWCGVKTGLNVAFVINHATREALLQADPKSAEILKPFLEGKDIKKWHVESRNIWLIFTRRGVDITKYPAILKYLEQFHEQLEPKPKNWPIGKHWPGRKVGAYKWYEIQDTVDYYEEFENAKLIYAHFQAKPLFSMAKPGIYCGDKAYISPEMSFCELGLLNSKVMWFILSGMTTRMRGGFYEAKTQILNKLPIPKVTTAQKQTIAQLAEQCQLIAESCYQKQQAVIQRIPDLCSSGRTARLLTNRLQRWWQLSFTEFRHEIKTAFKQDIPLTERNDWEQWLHKERDAVNKLLIRLADLEQELNTQTYELFELTAEEIQLIEDTELNSYKSEYDEDERG